MFNINGVIWDVLYVDPDDPYLKRSDGTYSVGACDNNTKFIYINNTLYGKKLKRVLCHEITHAAMFSYKVKLTLEQEEFIADLIATHGQEIIDITNKIKGAF